MESAINGSTLEIKFNTAVSSDIIDSSDLLAANGAITINGSTLDGESASLSEDGKTLSIYEFAGLFDGSYTIQIAKDEIPGEAEGTWVAEHKSVVTFDDKVRPSIVKVTPVSKYVFDVEFSEPIASGQTPVATYSADGTAVSVTSSTPSNFNKTTRVVLDSATVANKDITLLFGSLTDAVGNVAVPTSATVKVTNNDQIAPIVESVKALSTKVVEVKFSEPLSTVTKTGIKFNDVALAAGDTVALKAGDKSTVVLTLDSASTFASAPISFAVDAVKDLNDNGNAAFTKLINFGADSTGPVLASSKVLAGSPNQLKLVFDEAINALPGSAVTGYYIDTFGVKQLITIPSAKFSKDITDTTGKTVLVALNNGTADLAKNVDYTLEFAKGAFTDTFGNDSAKFAADFNNNGSSSAVKLKATGITDNGAGVIEVAFDNAVDPTTAKNPANYSVEGATVKAVTLTSNSASGATVELELEEGSVEVTGNYNVIVKNVKGFYSNIVAMSDTTFNDTIGENVLPTVKSAIVTKFTAPSSDAGSTTVTLTFSENITNTVGTADTDFELNVDGKAVTGVTATVATGSTTNALVVTIDKDLSTEFAAGKVITLVHVTGNDIVDGNNNPIATDAIKIVE